MKQITSALKDFVRERGWSLLILVITAIVAVIITITSWFWPKVYDFIESNHVFEAIVLAVLIEIVVLLPQRSESLRSFDVITNEHDVHTRILEIAEQRPIKKVRMISYGLTSRRHLISNLLQFGLQIEVLAQHPEQAIDKENIDRICDTIEWLKLDAGDKLQNLQLFLCKDVISLRAVLLEETRGDVKHAFFGWYTYSGSSVRGSQNPTVYVSTYSKQGMDIFKWIESTIREKVEKSSPVSPEELANLKQQKAG
jgi:hypothetical protein